MLDVDVNALSLWLERDALPKVSDADPSALAEYILALLDTIDLSQLSDSTKAECGAKLSEFFDSHTAAFVDDLFRYIQQQRDKTTAHAATSTNSRTEQRSSRRTSRSRSPARGRSRSRSRSREGRDGRARESREREVRESRRKGRGSEEREENGGHGGESRRGSGTLLIRDDRFGIQQVINRGGGGGRREVRGEYREDRDRDGAQRPHASGGHQGSRRPLQSSAPLVIARPYVPPPTAAHPSQSRSSRSVHLPASNPYSSSPSSSANPPFTPDVNPTRVVRAGRHTVVKRKRPEGGASDGSSRGGGGGGGGAVVELSNVPRFVLSMRMLTDHFSQFGALKGVEIDEDGGVAEIRYATQEEAVQATLGPPLHPAAALTLKAAKPDLRHPSTTAEEAVEDEDEEVPGEEAANGEEDASDSEFSAGHSGTTEAGPTIAVGRHTLTLKAKPPPPPPDDAALAMEMNHFLPLTLAAMAPAALTPAPAPPSALHTAELIRQRKATQQPQGAPAVSLAASAPPVTSEAERELKKSRVKMELLQKQIDQGAALVDRLSEAMKAQGGEGSEGYEEMQKKRAELEMSLEETRKRWRQERGKLVISALTGAGPPAIGAL